MKEFSLLYGPARGWLSVAALVAVALSVLLAAQGRTGGSQTVDAEAPVIVDPARFVGSSVPPGNGSPETSGWENVGRSGREVPVVPLQPSPEPMTDAGRELVRQAGAAGQ